MTLAPIFTPRRMLRSDLTLIITGAVAFIALCLLFSPFVADDAFIVGRYANNAVHGQGLVYNPGEYVSALTSPLHALVETVLALCGLPPVGSYRILAPLLVLAGWFIAIREHGLSHAELMLFTAAALFSPFLALWTVGGLETPILASLATLFTSRLVVISQRGSAKGYDFPWLGALAGLMFLTRYDSALVTVPPLMAILTIERRRPALWAGATLGILLAASWLVFAELYYGDVFPTSYYVKFVLGTRPRIDSLSTTLNFPLLSGLILPLLIRPRVKVANQPALSKAILLGAAVSLSLFLFYALRTSGEHMMFGFRLFVPYLLPISLMIATNLKLSNLFFPVAFTSWQATMIAVVSMVGINPSLLTHLPAFDRAYVEYQFITPATYGRFIDMLHMGAEAIKADWKATGRTDQPLIYLRTGGTGYWLPQFYVYETLISYRKSCGEPLVQMINASNYVQQLGISVTGTLVENIARDRPDIDPDAKLLFEAPLDWMGPTTTGYLFGATPTTLSLGTSINDDCFVGEAGSAPKQGTPTEKD